MLLKNENFKIMNLSQKEKDIYEARVCPYCNAETKVVPMEFIYGTVYSFGNDIICCSNFPECDSYVGTHSDGRPLGRLANKNLRNAKRMAHSAFDKLWKEGLMKRKEAYKKLSNFLKIQPEYTHIGMFKTSTCIKVAEWSENMFNKLNKNYESTIND